MCMGGVFPNRRIPNGRIENRRFLIDELRMDEYMNIAPGKGL